jgi:hypothetical protein
VGLPLHDPSPVFQDVYCEADFMAGGFVLPTASRSLVEQSFAKQAIRMHIDDGWLPGPDGPGGATGSGGEPLPYVFPLRLFNYAGYTGNTPNNKLAPFDVLSYKNGELAGDPNGNGVQDPIRMAPNRLGIFHYCVMGDTYWDPVLQPIGLRATMTSPGAAEITGDDFFVGPGTVQITWWQNWGWIVTNPAVIAGIFMHEMGHNLGLLHQGVGGIAWAAQNYRSVMNSWSPTIPAPFPGGDLASWIYQALDFSDGSRGTGDFNDWGNLNLAAGINTWHNHAW